MKRNYFNKNKYSNNKEVVDGVVFDSKKEAGRYIELKLLEKVGKIKDLKLQPRFELQSSYTKNGKKIRRIDYIADFTYFDNDLEQIIVEDVKGFKTKEYRLKKKIFEYKYKDLSITEI